MYVSNSSHIWIPGPTAPTEHDAGARRYPDVDLAFEIGREALGAPTVDVPNLASAVRAIAGAEPGSAGCS